MLTKISRKLPSHNSYLCLCALPPTKPIPNSEVRCVRAGGGRGANIPFIVQSLSSYLLETPRLMLFNSPSSKIFANCCNSGNNSHINIKFGPKTELNKKYETIKKYDNDVILAKYDARFDF